MRKIKLLDKNKTLSIKVVVIRLYEKNYGFNKILNYFLSPKIVSLFILLYLITNFCFAGKLISESSGFLKNISSFQISNTTEYKIFTIKGHFKNNFGIYGITDCNGYRETKKSALIFLKVVCKNTTQHGDTFFTLGERKSEFNRAGVGNVKYIDGTGVFKKLIGINCIYAVNKVLDSDFVVTKCDIPDELFEELKDYGEK